jgi:Pentapeptide repeats (9 copies)
MSERAPLGPLEFLAALQSGNAEAVEERRVTGAVILRGATISQPVRISYVYFEGEVDFTDTTFEGSVDFSGCTFAKTLSLRNARVDGDLILDEVQVQDLPSLWGKRLPDSRTCDLAGVEVTGDLTLDRSLIAGALFATGIDVGGLVKISGTEIDGGTDVSNSNVGGDLIFGAWIPSYGGGSRALRLGFFNRGLRATNLQVRGSLQLHGVQIDGALLLWGGTFESSIYAWPLVAQGQIIALPIVTGEFALSASRVSGHVQLSSLRVGGVFNASSLTCSAFIMRPFKSVGNQAEVYGPPCEVARLDLSGAQIASDLQLSMLRVTGGALAEGRQGLFIKSTTVGGELRLWNQWALARESEVITPLERDALNAGAVVCGDVEIRSTTVAGDCDLTNLWASGVVRLNDSRVRGNISFRSRCSLLDNPLSNASLRERLLDNAVGFLRARTAALDLGMVRCDQEIDLSGLDLVEEGKVPQDLRRGSITARSAQANGVISLHHKRDDGSEDVTGIPGVADFEQVETARLSISTKSFAASGRQGDSREGAASLRLAGAQIAELAIQPLEGPWSWRHWLRGLPSLRFPRTDLRDLSVQVWSIGERADAKCFRALLAGDEAFHRDTFVRIEQVLRNGGHEAEATKIYKEKCRQEQAQRWRDAGQWPGLLWRWPRLAVRQLLLYLPFSLFMGFGTAPLRLLFVIALGWAAMLPAYYVRTNFQQSLTARIAQGNTGEPKTPTKQEWSGTTPFFASMRYHVPIIGLTAREDWELADQGRLCWALSAPEQPGEPSCARVFPGPLAPEDLGLLVSLLNWALWPLVLTFTIRKLLR